MTERAFDPSRYLTKVGSADYLEIKWRLVWLREVHPDAVIETDLVEHNDMIAVFKARVAIHGGGAATGWGSEGYNDFRDYLEKAETKAIGRALAALGFGTQFAHDFDAGAGVNGVADSPIDFASTRGRRMDSGGDRRTVASLNEPVTPKQLKFIQAIAREKGMSDDELNQEVERAYGKATVAELDRRDASAFIDRLQSRRPVTDLAGFSEGETATPAQTVVPSPVAAPAPPHRTQSATTHVDGVGTVERATGEITTPQTGDAGEPATERQMKFIHAIGKEKGLSHDDLHNEAMKAYGVGLGQLPRRDASAFIDRLQAKNAQRPAEPTPIRQNVAADDTSYTEFWKYARSRNVDRDRFVELTQQGVEGKTASELRALLDDALSSLNAAVQR